MARSKISHMKHPARILVAEDDDSLRQLLVRYLTSLGYAVDAVADGAAAVNRIATGMALDVVITDVLMPGTNGLEVLRAAKSADRYAEVIFLTGAPDLATTVKALREGDAFDYITKPFPNVEILRATVDRALERRRLRMDNERLQRELERQANTDGLTGALTRRAFFDLGEREFARAARHREPLSLIMLDLDRFDDINERHGAAAGDAVLVRFALACRESLRTEDIMGRYWADKLVCLLPVTDIANAETVAERIRASMAGTPVEVGDQRLTITTSGGVTTRQDADRGLDTLLRRAERALQQAKSGGGNRVTVER